MILIFILLVEFCDYLQYTVPCAHSMPFTRQLFLILYLIYGANHTFPQPDRLLQDWNTNGITAYIKSYPV